MNAHAAGDLDAAEVEAADLLALAWLDDGGAPCPAACHEHSPAAPVRAAITAPERSIPRIRCGR
jgi:hypothetical protein